MFKLGDSVVIKSNLYWDGQDIGNKKGEVVDINGYILVNVEGICNNPVKCLSYEISKYNNDGPFLKQPDVDTWLKEVEDMFREWKAN